MKLGAEPKKIAVFAGLILLAAVVHFSSGDDRPKSTPPRPGVSAPAPVSGSAGPRTPIQNVSKSVARPASNRRATQEFKPVLRPRRVEDRVDPATIDPTLRIELLTRLANVPIQGGSRPLFEFSSAPPPPIKAPDPGKIVPVKVIPVKLIPDGAPPAAPTTPVAPAKPQAPPIPLKFYGFTSARAGAKRAFFLENEDVFVASEGTLVKNRYKVVRINLNSVVMEDIEFKQQQTLPLTEQLQ